MTLEVSAWSTTPGSNTSVSPGSINIAEGCAAANINDAIRAIMAAVKDMYDTIVGTYAAKGANTDITGLRTSVALTETGTVNASTLGFRGAPAGQSGGSLTLALTDSGKTVELTSGGLTIPANASVAFPDKTMIMVLNTSGSSQTISITSDTLYLAGVGTTGSRTIPNRGMATLLKSGTTTWYIAGPGVA